MSNNSNIPAAPEPSYKRALTINEFCDRYGVGRSTTYELIAAGRLPDVKIGGRRLIPVDAAEQLLARSE